MKRILLPCLLAFAICDATASAVTPDSIPSEGRSLFDYLAIVKGNDGIFRYDLPTNYRKMIETIVLRAGGAPLSPALGSPLILNFPAGRSLQRADGDLKDPRRVASFPSHHALGTELGFNLRDRLYIGHSPRKKQLEVISYNEQAGRYEFQVVSDYGDGLTPKVRYTDRPTCIRCHRADAPIFPPRDWDESSANPIAAAGIAWANGLVTNQPDGSIVPQPGATLDDGLVPVGIEVDRAWEFNRSVLRAAEWQFVQSVWQKGCRVGAPIPESANYTGSDCRAQLVIMALANKLEISFASLVMPTGNTETAFLPAARIKALVASNFPGTDLKFNIYNIPGRNPYKDFRMPMKQADFVKMDLMVKADVAIGDHIPDETIAADAPNRVAVDDLANDSDRIVSAIRRLWSNIKDLHTADQWAAVTSKIPPRTDPNAGKALIDLYLKIRKNEAFSDRPIRRGALLTAVMDGLGAKPAGAKVSCCGPTEGFPPLLFTDDTIITPGLVAERQILRGRCSACHKSETSLIGFLFNETALTDRELVMQILAKELKPVPGGSGIRMELCRRINWTLPTTDLAVTSRMPQSTPLRKDILSKEQANPQASERKLLMDVARRAMTRVTTDDAWLNDLRTALVKFNSPFKTMNTTALKEAIGATAAGPDCQYTPFGGLEP